VKFNSRSQSAFVVYEQLGAGICLEKVGVPWQFPIHPTVTPSPTTSPTATPTSVATPTPTATATPSPTPTPAPHSGDVNGDGTLSPGDAQLAFYYFMDCEALAPSVVQYAAADFLRERRLSSVRWLGDTCRCVGHTESISAVSRSLPNESRIKQLPGHLSPSIRLVCRSPTDAKATSE